MALKQLLVDYVLYLVSYCVRCHVLQIMRDVLSLPAAFWVTCVVCGFGFPSVSSLSNIAPAYLSKYEHMMQKSVSQEVQNLGKVHVLRYVLCRYGSG